MSTRLQERYQQEILPALVEKFNYSSIMQGPKLEKNCFEYGCW